MKVSITLPWPPKGLQPHAKGSWRPKARATKAYRADAHWLAKEAKVPTDREARLTFTYHPPNRARRDVQNLHGQMKPAIDGIADAMGCDDNAFRCRFPESLGEPVKGGAVIVTVTRQNDTKTGGKSA